MPRSCKHYKRAKKHHHRPKSDHHHDRCHQCHNASPCHCHTAQPCHPIVYNPMIYNPPSAYTIPERRDCYGNMVNQIGKCRPNGGLFRPFTGYFY